MSGWDRQEGGTRAQRMGPTRGRCSSCARELQDTGAVLESYKILELYSRVTRARDKGNKRLSPKDSLLLRTLSSPTLKRPAPQPAPSLHLRLVKSLKKGQFLCYSLVVGVIRKPRKQPWLSRKPHILFNNIVCVRVYHVS